MGKTEKGGNCKKNEILYIIECKDCGDMYPGETSRNGHTRGIEHLEDSESKDPERQEKSVLLRHMNEKHNGRKVQFSMKVVKTFQHDPLRRQCAEAIWIKNIEPSKLINNKKEYHQPGDVQLRYEKNENPEIKRRKQEIKEAKKKRVDKNEDIIEKNKTPEKSKSKHYENMPISIFIRNMRVESDIRDNTKYSCDQCDYKTIETGRLKNHKDTVHEKIGYSCNQCEYKTKDKGHLKRHVESVHENIVPSCNQCEYKSKGEEDLKSHIDSVHKNTNIQEDEWQISTQEMIIDSRERRKLVLLGQEKIKCDHCEWSTGSKTLLNRHMKNHKDQQRPLGTPASDATNENKEDKSPSKENKRKYIQKRIKCEKCEKKFNKESRFKIHMESVHATKLNTLNKVTSLDKKRSLRNTKDRGTL